MGTSRFSARQLRGRTLKYLPQVSFIRAAAGFCDNDAWVTTHWGDIGQKQWCINNADIRVPTFRALARCARLCSAVKTRLYTSSGDERGAPDLRCRESSSFLLTRATGSIWYNIIVSNNARLNPYSARYFLSILSNSYAPSFCPKSFPNRPIAYGGVQKRYKNRLKLYTVKNHIYKERTRTTLRWRIEYASV